jgi:protein-disulfide isomerase
MSRLSDQIATFIVVLCAVVMAATSFMRNDGANRRASAQSTSLVVAESQVTAIEPFILKEGLDRPFTIVEFIDVECPYCANFAKTLDSAQVILGDSLQVNYVNYPIRPHRFARSGANAITCAFSSGSGSQFVRTVYANQDSIGTWPWTKFASVAGIADSTEFARCSQSTVVNARVDSGQALAKELGVNSTPTLLIGRQIHRGALSLTDLLKIARERSPGSIR